MVVVVGKVPEEIRIPRAKYIELLSRLDTATHAWCPHETELAHEIMDIARTFVRSQPEVDGQIELPLEWDRAGR